MEDRYDDILISGKAKKGKPKNKALAIDVDDFFDDSAKESRDEPDSAQLPNVAKLQVQDNSAKAAAQGLLTPESANKENRSRSPTSPSRRRLKGMYIYNNREAMYLLHKGEAKNTGIYI